MGAHLPATAANVSNLKLSDKTFTYSITKGAILDVSLTGAPCCLLRRAVLRGVLGVWRSGSRERRRRLTAPCLARSSTPGSALAAWSELAVGGGLEAAAARAPTARRTLHTPLLRRRQLQY